MTLSIYGKSINQRNQYGETECFHIFDNVISLFLCQVHAKMFKCTVGSTSLLSQVHRSISAIENVIIFGPNGLFCDSIVMELLIMFYNFCRFTSIFQEPIH